MNDVIFEKFKGTGNRDVHLDRKLSDKGAYRQSTSGNPFEAKPRTIRPRFCVGGPRAFRRTGWNLLMDPSIVVVHVYLNAKQLAAAIRSVG